MINTTLDFGNTQGAIHLTDTEGTYTAPAGMVIYAVVPQPIFTGKAIARADKGDLSWPSMTGVNGSSEYRKADGAEIVELTQIFYGEYASVTISDGAADLYLRRES